jgi:plasmid stabilization system protein ParE
MTMPLVVSTKVSEDLPLIKGCEAERSVAAAPRGRHRAALGEARGRLARRARAGTDALPSLSLIQSYQPRHPVQASLALACHLRNVVPGNADVGQLTVRESIQLPCSFTGTQPTTKA